MARSSRAPRSSPGRAPVATSAGGWPIWIGVIALALAGLAAYSNAWSGPFIFDDRATVIDNPSIRDLSAVAQVFSPPQETPVAGRPLSNLTFAVNYALGELDVTGYHFINIALHLGCGLLLFAVLGADRKPPRESFYINRKTTPEVVFGLPPIAIALIWLVHPLNTEAVDYVSQRTETLMAGAMLLTLYASIRALDSPRRSLWTTTAILACAAGMACKETMVVAPVLVVLYDRAFRFDSLAQAWRARWRLYAGLGTTWVVLAALLFTSPRSQSAGFSAPDAAPWTYLLNQAQLITRYLRLAVWPDHLVLFYGAPLPLTLRDVWPQAAFIVVLAGVTLWAWRREPRLGFAGAWFFLTLAPSSSILPIMTEVGAERRMYLPLMAVIGIIVAAVGTLGRWSPGGGRVRRSAGVAAMLVVAAALGARTIARNQDYVSSLRLAETTAAGWPSPAADSMLGTELAAAGRLSEAESVLRRAAVAYVPARYYLATVLDAQGRAEDAVAAFEHYLATAQPTLVEVRKSREMLAALYVRARRWPEAIAQYRVILTIDADDSAAHGRLADALVTTQAYAEAIPHYQTLLAARPSDARALGGLGIAYAQTGQLPEAIQAFQRAVNLEPRDPHARQNLARALLAAGRLDEARHHALEAQALAPNDPATRELLARIK